MTSDSRRRLVAGVTASAALAIISACSSPQRAGSADTAGNTIDSAKLERITTLQQRIAELEKQADRVEDASEVKRLQRAYGYYVDRGMWDQVADLFADDATIEIALDGVYVSKPRIREYLHALGGGRTGLVNGQLNEQIQLQPVINVAADGLTAKGRWRAVILSGQLGREATWSEGPYENEYVKQNGVWKIGKLHWYQTYVVPYEGGWAKNKNLTDGTYVSGKLPPDRPPTERYDVWPGVYTPAYHYKNPVTGK